MVADAFSHAICMTTSALAGLSTRLSGTENKIAKIVNIIIDDSLQYLPEPALRKVYDKLIGNATSITSRTATQLTLSSYLGSKVISGVMLSFISRVALRGLTGGVIAQGVISRACEASR